MRKLGFVLGKFMPPHKGHEYLCEFARNFCDELTIAVCSMPDEPIPGKLRYEWMKKLFPTCNVFWTDEVLPQEPRGGDDAEFWRIWADVIRQAMQASGDPDWQMPDYIFASEPYGLKLAESVGAKFIPCDLGRHAVPTSGTDCRNFPNTNWKFLPDIVKPYFQKRVVMFGPESTGKSTLAARLADYYGTLVVPEYGRTWTEFFGPEVTSDDLQNIVSGHLASRKALAKNAGRVLIEDTDPVMTAVWGDMLLGHHDPVLDQFNDYPDLYLLCDIDIPWVDDGTRYFPDKADRERFFQLCKKTLEDRGLPYVICAGGKDNRLSRAVKAIDRLIE